MLFIYIMAAMLSSTIATLLTYMLTLTDAWTLDHTLAIVVMVSIIIGCVIGTYYMVRAAYTEYYYYWS